MIDFRRIAAAVEALAEKALPCVDAFMASVDRIEQGAKHLGAQGWPLSPSFDADQVLRLLDLPVDTTLDEAFTNFYEADGGSYRQETLAMLEASPTMGKWTRLLPQVEAAMARGHDTICVPALLIMVEGLAPSSPTTRVRLATLVADRLGRYPSNTVEHLCWQTVHLFVVDLCKDSSFTEPEPPRLNRHWILHGRSEADWTRTDCIRLLHGVRVLAELQTAEPT